MALQTSGAISLSQIAAEFGGTTPHSLSEYYAGGGLVPAGTSGTNGAVPSSGAISFSQFFGTTAILVGQQAWTTAGTYSWTVPGGITQISIVCIGGGGSGTGFVPTQGPWGWYYGAGGGGGDLRYVNNYSVTPGQVLTIVVGAGGIGSEYGVAGNSGGDSMVSLGATTLCRAAGGARANLDTPPNRSLNVGTGGNGGPSMFYGDWSAPGGGGSGGYVGNGGSGRGVTEWWGAQSYEEYNNANGQERYYHTSGNPPTGDGAVAGWSTHSAYDFPNVGNSYGGTGTHQRKVYGGKGGGSSVMGQSGANPVYGGGNMPPEIVFFAGKDPSGNWIESSYMYYPGWLANSNQASGGAVRIIYPGSSRTFPSVNTGDL